MRHLIVLVVVASIAPWTGSCGSGTPTGETGAAGDGLGRAGAGSGGRSVGAGLGGSGGAVTTPDATAGNGGAAGSNGTAGSNAAAGNSGAAGSDAVAGGNGATSDSGMSPPEGGPSDAPMSIPDAGEIEAGKSDGPASVIDDGMSAGCGANTIPPSASVQQTLQVSGATRYYLLYVPSGYSSSKAIPIIFIHHGRNGNNVDAAAPWDSKDWYGRTALKAASNGQAILVYPQGSGSPPGNTTTLNNGISGSTSGWGDDDLPFFDALFATLKAEYCINTKRVFAVGYSMGGMFSNTLGCARASVIRAIAPIEGWGPGSPPTSGTPTCATSMGQEAALVIHGTKDGTIPYAIGQASASFWRTDSGCSASTSAASMYSTSKLSCVGYQGCRAGREVFFCTHQGDHQIPVDAGTEIWKFFSNLPDR